MTDPDDFSPERAEMPGDGWPADILVSRPDLDQPCMICRLPFVAGDQVVAERYGRGPVRVMHQRCRPATPVR
jgi:hypothetical protein